VLDQRGERPAAGTTIAVLLDNSRTFARVYVPEQLRARITPGVRLEVRIDGVADRFDGRVRWVSADASFTPYFALTEHDRSRLSYLAEIDLDGADALPAGIPLQVDFASAD
jgi:HlyD family secretion protein